MSGREKEKGFQGNQRGKQQVLVDDALELFKILGRHGIRRNCDLNNFARVVYDHLFGERR